MRKQVATVLAGLTVLGLSMSAMGQGTSAGRGAEARSGAERARQTGVLERTKKTGADENEITPGAGKPRAGSLQMRGVVTEVSTGTLTLTEKSGQVTVLQLKPDTQVRGNRTLEISKLKERQQVRIDGSLSTDETTFTAKIIHLVPEKTPGGNSAKKPGAAGLSAAPSAAVRKHQASGELVIEGKKAVLISGDKKTPVVFGPNVKVMEAISGTPQMLAKGMNVFVIGQEIEGRKVAAMISLDASADVKKPAPGEKDAKDAAKSEIPKGIVKAGAPAVARPPVGAAKPVVGAKEKEIEKKIEEKAADAKAPAVEKAPEKAPEKTDPKASAESAPAK
jgi:hypothetical protein